MEELIIDSTKLIKDPLENTVAYSISDVSLEDEDNERKYIKLPEKESISDYNFIKNGFLSNEPWNKIINLNARVIQISKINVICECIIDKDKRLLETRSFPKELFSHIEHLQEKTPIIINIKLKPGSTRIDVYNGSSLVDTSLFELNDNWKSLENSGLDKPFSLNA